MGLLISPSSTSPWAQDPEALIVFTLEIARDEPRLFDELLDWMLHNEHRLSARRLRAMCIDETDRRLTDAAVSWLARHRPRVRWSPHRGVDAASLRQTDLEPLFRAGAPVRKPDPDFAAVGFLRPLLLPSGRSVAPDLTTLINLSFRLRAILGVGIRSEVVRIMLTGPPTPATAQTLAQASGYSKRNVHDALTGLAEAQVLASFNIDGEQRYRIDIQTWSALLQRDAIGLSVQRAWPQVLGPLRLIRRWSDAQKNLDRSDYMRRSETRQLLLSMSRDVAFAGIEINPKLTAERAPSELERVIDSLLAQLTPETDDS
jgi:hypothetical protein